MIRVSSEKNSMFIKRDTNLCIFLAMAPKLGENLNALLCVAASATAPLLFGLAIGSSALGTTMSGQQTDGNKVTTLLRGEKAERLVVFTEDERKWFVSLLTIGAMFGALSGGPISQKFGRRMTLIFTVPLFAASWILLALSKTAIMTYISRIILGLGVGINSGVSPLYIAEVSPKHLRGALGVATQLSIVIGIFFAYLLAIMLSFEFESKNWNEWRTFAWLMLIPTGLMLVGMFFSPETPDWLAGKGRIEESKAVLSKIRGGKESADEIEALETIAYNATNSESRNDSTPISAVFSCKKQLFIAIMLQVLQQFSGINAVMFFMKDMYTLANMSSKATDSWSLALTIAQIVVTIIAALIIERMGRKPLLAIGASGMAVAMGSMALLLKIGGKQDTLFGLSSVGYIVFFSIGVGAIPWLILGEIFPENVRSIASSMASSVNWICAFIVSFTCPGLQLAIGFSPMLMIYAAFAALMVIFTIVFVPETKGRSIEEIQSLFGNNNKHGASKLDDMRA
jgi:MFS transporter, SP family, ERD6-like sugar transporter